MKNIDLMRPKEIYDSVLKQREIDGNSFAEKYKEKFEFVNCPACDSKGEDVFEKHGFKHRVCSRCKTMFCSPRPADDLLSVYYSDYEAARMWTRLLLKSDTERKTLQYSPRVEKIISVIKEHGGIENGVALDVGAGSGAFSLCLKKTNFFKDVIALDFSESCVQACKKQGLNSLMGKIEDIESDSVDFICINDLIEHVFDPQSFLKECFRVLRKEGFIAIATPNGEGFDFKILKEKTKNIIPPEHLTYFNPHSLSLVLEKTGFDTVLAETPGKLDVEMILKERESGYPLNHRNEYLDYLLGQSEEIINNFQAFLVNSKLSSHMLLVAKKIDRGVK